MPKVIGQIDQPPFGTECDCGKFTEFGIWAVAHWDEPLKLECKCGEIIWVLGGKIYTDEELEEMGY